MSENIYSKLLEKIICDLESIENNLRYMENDTDAISDIVDIGALLTEYRGMREKQ